jgi:hypothetical protein
MIAKDLRDFRSVNLAASEIEKFVALIHGIPPEVLKERRTSAVETAFATRCEPRTRPEFVAAINRLAREPIQAPCGYCPAAGMIVHPPHKHSAEGRCVMPGNQALCARCETRVADPISGELCGREDCPQRSVQAGDPE